MKIGDLQVDIIKDGNSVVPGSFFGDTAGGHHEDLIGADGKVDLPIACFLVRTRGLTVLIDAGLGPHVFEWQPKEGDRLRLEGGALPAAHDGEIVPCISALATPGHTPGHHCFVLSSGTERAMILGDVVSCPLQIEYAEREGLADMDPDLGRITRERVLRELEGSDTAVGGPHFPELRFGRVLVGSGRRYWS